jgi:hypothetical protein
MILGLPRLPLLPLSVTRRGPRPASTSTHSTLRSSWLPIQSPATSRDYSTELSSSRPPTPLTATLEKRRLLVSCARPLASPSQTPSKSPASQLESEVPIQSNRMADSRQQVNGEAGFSQRARFSVRVRARLGVCLGRRRSAVPVVVLVVGGPPTGPRQAVKAEAAKQGCDSASLEGLTPFWLPIRQAAKRCAGPRNSGPHRPPTVRCHRRRSCPSDQRIQRFAGRRQALARRPRRPASNQN